MLVAAACGGNSTPQQPKAAAVFDEADIAAIILLAADAPSGTEHQAEGSGQATIEDIAEDDSEKTLLTEAGFKTAHEATFATPGLLTATDPSDIKAGARLIAAVAIALKDAAGASRVIDEFKKDFNADAQGVGNLAAPGVGDAGFAYSFSALDAETPLGGFTIIWRHGNAVFAIIAAGVPGAATEAETRSLAVKMDGRAEARA
jgi:hypothetical protein